MLERVTKLAKPVAVLISDIHYSLPNLKLADAAMRMSIAKANELMIPLIVAGDLHDTKANLRGECVNAMIDTFRLLKVSCKILRGNHDSLNEKSTMHALNFLCPFAQLMDEGFYHTDIGTMIPYQHDSAYLKDILRTIPKGSTLIMHQGVTGSNSGEYIQDKSAISKDDVAGMRVISGHYHARQTIELPDGGKWDYIGNPFTTNFGEANDPPKGFQILMDDGSLEFVPTNLRKHIISEVCLINNSQGVTTNLANYAKGDLVWFKVKGTKEILNKVGKRRIEEIADYYNIDSYKLDLIPLDAVSQVNAIQNLTKTELLDQLIDSLTNTSDEAKVRLKQIWKGLCE